MDIISSLIIDGKKRSYNRITISKYKYVIWMDADFQHPPQYIKKFFELINKNK